MARGYGRGNGPDPVAFSGYNLNKIIGAINQLANEQRHMAMRHLSIEDLRQLFVPAACRHSVKEAFQYNRPHIQDQVLVLHVASNDERIVLSAPLKLNLRWDHDLNPEGFFAPRDGICIVQPDAPTEMIERLLQFQQDILRITWEWGLVRYVFGELNCNGFCNTPQQMRFVWPAIRHLVDKANMLDLGKNLIEASPRAGDRARVPGNVQPYLVQTVNIVARTLVVGPVDTVNEKRDFKLVVHMPTFRLPNGAQFVGVN